MKIELTCPYCEAVLRVDAEHAGKQLRCPTCQSLVPIPTEFNAGTTDQSEYQQPSEDFSSQPTYINPQVNSASSSEETLSLTLGILGIIMNIGCGCLFPVWIILNLIGLFKGIASNGPMRTACIVTNGIGLGIAGLHLVSIFGFGILDLLF